MGFKSPWAFFCGGWGGSVANIMNTGYYTLYEKSYILEIEN